MLESFNNSTKRQETITYEGSDSLKYGSCTFKIGANCHRTNSANSCPDKQGECIMW